MDFFKRMREGQSSVAPPRFDPAEFEPSMQDDLFEEDDNVGPPNVYFTGPNLWNS